MNKKEVLNFDNGKKKIQGYYVLIIVTRDSLLQVFVYAGQP
jgi:hypothetical protein